ncbi:hypothetical protein PN462_01685 [Spirulina sp. CS-785/01]|uniref:hypothetical protein n=1 Tax=Spirulina sp. CS-785/01 TaxID=3021716 RepID=UPI00232FA1F5|nr:hypothetical protein [Spirulina sp. CS-785/01]MDB9311796.1 hypothetical protein [Spirulina sp. CS-785/01]
MLFLIIAWLILGSICWTIGTGILHRLDRGQVWDKNSDRAILAIWLGLIPLTLSLLTLSFFTPLSPLSLLATSLLLILLTRKPHLSHDLTPLLRHLSWRTGSGLLLILLLDAALLTTGCPLFPSSLFCLNTLPWAIGTETTQQMSHSIQNCARWSCPPPPPSNPQPGAWILPWLQQERRATFLLLCTLAALGGLLRLPRRYSLPGQLYLISLGLLGSSFVFYGSPSLRIGISYFYIIPTLLLTHYCHQQKHLRLFALWVIAGTVNLWLQPSTTLALMVFLTIGFTLALRYFISPRQVGVFLGALLLLVGLVPIKMYLTPPGFQPHWAWPPPIQPLNPFPFVTREINNITYYTPDPDYKWMRAHNFQVAEDRCWNAPLPCTPEVTHTDIRLRKPSQGIAGGFVREADDE